VRAVLDANVLISALLSRAGTPAQLLVRWLAGEFELVVSRRLLEELEAALAYPKLRARIPADAAEGLIDLLRESAVLADDPANPPSRAADPDDDYLLALAEAERAVLVTGDGRLLELGVRYPVLSARAFVDSLE
jgi:uncharacterized protein